MVERGSPTVGKPSGSNERRPLFPLMNEGPDASTFSYIISKSETGELMEN